MLNKILDIFRRSAGGGGSRSGADARSYAPRAGASSLLPFDTNTAMCISTVFRCVKLLSESVANLPVLFRKRQDGIFVEDDGHRFAYLLNVQPDNAVNAFDFWRQVVVNVLLDGNAYIIPRYNALSMDVDRLVLCSRGSVSHDTVNDRYSVCDLENGISGTFSEEDVIHIKGMTVRNHKAGVSVLEFARLTSGIAYAGDRETLNRFENGGNVRGLVSNDTSVRGFGEYQDKQLENTARNLDDRFQAGERIVGLPGQVDFKQISLSSTDMQFLESRKFTVREICRFFGVHPSFVFDDTSNNYKSAEQANVAFLSHTLNPILRSIEVELLRKLISPSLWTAYKFEFDRKGLYACDLDSKVKYQRQTIEAGIFTVNDWRKAENKRPVKCGDEVLISTNLRRITEASVPAAGEESNDKNEDEDKQE